MLGYFLAILSFYTAVAFLGRILIPVPDSSRWRLLSDFGFFFFYSLFYMFVKTQRGRKWEQGLFLFSYALFCLSPLLFYHASPGSLYRSLSLPVLYILFLGPGTGRTLSLALLPLPLYLVRESGAELLLNFTAAYFGFLIASVIVFRVYKERVRPAEQGSPAEGSPSIGDALIPGGEAGLYPRCAEESESDRYLVNSFEKIFNEKGEFYVMYQKSVLDTLERVPYPDSVLSYILFEGISNVNLFDKEGAADDPRMKSMGKYVLASCSIESFMSKVESVIEIREAKKSLEFNKIQTQIHRVLPRESSGEKDVKIEELFSRYNITDREIEISRCILGGMSNKEISSELFISIDTVKTHVRNILKKCEVNSRIELIKLFSNIDV